MSVSLTAVAEATQVHVRVASTVPGAVRVVLQRTMLGDTAQVRAWPHFEGLWSHRDVDVLFGTPLTYQATLVDSDGRPVAVSDPVTVTVTTTTAVLRDALVPARKVPISLVGAAAGNYSTDVRRELLYPVGRAAPIAITDVRQKSTGTTSLYTATSSERTALAALLHTGNILLLTGPVDFDTDSWPMFLSVGQVAVSRVAAAAHPARLWTLDWVQVDGPPLPEPQPGTTWRDLLEQGTRWRDIATTPWHDVLYPPPAPEPAGVTLRTES